MTDKKKPVWHRGGAQDGHMAFSGEEKVMWHRGSASIMCGNCHTFQ